MSLFTRSTELKRFKRGTLPKVALAVLLVIPLIYGALYLWAFWAPTENLNRLPVAVVNLDEPAEKPGGGELTAGADVVEQLLDGGDLDWQPLDGPDAAEEARAAVEDGDVYFSVTIPRDFSSTLAGLQDDPKAGEIEVVYNDNNSFLASTLGKQAMVQLRDAVAETATQTAAEQVLVGVEKLSDGTRDAAEAADTLDGGTTQLAEGSEKLSAGLGELAEGTGTLAASVPALANGTSELATGLGGARDGSAALHDGSSALASGARDLSAGSGKVSTGAAALAEGASALSDGITNATAGATQLREGMDELAAQAPALTDGITAAHTGSEQLAGGLESLSGGSAQLSGALDQIVALAAANPEMTLAELDAALASQGSSLSALQSGAQQIAGGVSTANTGATSLAAGLGELSSKAAALPEKAVQAQTGATQLEQGLATLDSGSATLAEKSTELADGAAQVAGGAPTLVTGADKLANGSGELANGIASAAAGADRLAGGASELTAGVTRLDSGAQEASSKSGDLAKGAERVSSGSAEFSQRLADGAAEAPSFEPGQGDRIAETMAAPVQLSEHTENEVQGFGEGFAPFFIALASFVGALITWLILRPLPKRPFASNVSGLRSVLTGLLPAALIGVGQVVIMMLVLVYGIGMQPAHWLGMAGFMLLTTLAFLSLQQMFIALFGTATGRVVSLVLLMLMLSSSGGTYPVETTPKFFQVLHPFMPASYVVEGLRPLIGGGIDARFWGSLLVIAGVLVFSLAVSAIAARRQKVWTMDRLHPELAI